MNPVEGIAENIVSVLARMERAAERAGRDPEEIRLVAVTKTVPVERIREALGAGIRELGENYLQEAEAKFEGLEGGFTRHLIGHLQRNKSRRAAALFDLIQTIDSAEIAQAVGRHAMGHGRTVDALIEVNLARESTKHGVDPDRALDLAAQVAGVQGIRLRGMMAIGPLTDDESAVRRSFAEMRRLFMELPEAHRQVLSMGMSGDFELAIAEGSTMVRIGTGIFGARRSQG